MDIDPAKAGRDLGEVVGLGRTLRVTGDPDLASTLKAAAPDVVVLCTSSALSKVVPQIEEVLKRKVPIVSTTEELAYPWYSQRRLAASIDAAAKRAKVAVLGTGVNPGFVMDALAITLTGVCERVDRITITRIQDARIRRLPFQQKIGSGLTAGEFAAKVARKTVRHVGLTESIAMIAAAFGWKLERVTDEIHVDAETLTGWRCWQDGPAEYKRRFDIALGAGLNHPTFHTFAHFPPAAGRPGFAYHAGEHFNVNTTWWDQAGPLIEYMARCDYLLQQGLFAADVAFYYGDQAPNLVPSRRIDPDIKPRYPDTDCLHCGKPRPIQISSLDRGYDYDYVNSES